MKSYKKLYYLLFICILTITIYFIFLSMPYLKQIVSFLINLLVPFLIGFIISFILYPLINFLVKKKMSRKVAVAVISIAFIGIVVTLMIVIVPMLAKELTNTLDSIPKIASDIRYVIDKITDKLHLDDLDFMPSEKEIISMLNKNITKFLSRILGIMQKTISYIISIVLGFILSIYFMLDFDKILNFVKRWCLDKNEDKLLVLLREIRDTMMAYIRGVLCVSLLLMISSTIFLTILKVDFALLLGIIIGVTDIIPYFGPYIGGGIAVLVAFTKSYKVAIITAVFVVLQQMVEAWFISPKIQSKNIKTHPILVMLSLLFFGKLLGIFGMIIAVPILAVLQAFFRVYFCYQKEEKNA